MAASEVPTGQASDGYGLVLWVPTIADPTEPTVAELTAGTVVDITYSLVGDGFRRDTTENEITVNRYTLKEQLGLPGTTVNTLELQYVTGSPADEELTPGLQGFIVQRLGIANETAIAAAQTVDVLPVITGIQRKVAPTTNTELQKVQKMFIRAQVLDDVAVVA